MNGDDITIYLARLQFHNARRVLEDTLISRCPKPHGFKQHRDRKPPWCPSCGYTMTGERVKDIDHEQTRTM